MSEVSSARGGDGWSSWTVTRTPTGGYEVLVVSNAEKARDGLPKIVANYELFTGGRDAIDKAIGESSSYAYRMFS